MKELSIFHAPGKKLECTLYSQYRVLCLIIAYKIHTRNGKYRRRIYNHVTKSQLYSTLHFCSKHRSGRKTRRTAAPSWRRWARNCGRHGVWTAPVWSCGWAHYLGTRPRPAISVRTIFPSLFPERGRKPTCTLRHYPSVPVRRFLFLFPLSPRDNDIDFSRTVPRGRPEDLLLPAKSTVLIFAG